MHESPADPIQRLLIAAKRDSYFRPHRHPQTWEFAVVLRGQFDVVLLDDSGLVTERMAVGPAADTIGFELPANAWHVWLPAADDSVFLEIKQGPYDASQAADFAAWSPAEGAPQVDRFVEILRQAKVGDCVAQPPVG